MKKNTNPPAAGPWLTSREAAAHLRCSLPTLRRRIQDGTLQAYRGPGRDLLFKAAELDTAVAPVRRAQ